MSRRKCWLVFASQRLTYVLIYLFHGCSSVVCSQFVLDLFPVQITLGARNRRWFTQEISKTILNSRNQQLHKTTRSHDRVVLSSVERGLNCPSRLDFNANENPIVAVALNHQVKARDTFKRGIGRLALPVVSLQPFRPLFPL